MQTAGGYRFPLGEYLLLFLASLLLICSHIYLSGRSSLLYFFGLESDISPAV